MPNSRVEGSLLDQIQAADPGAATPLHDRFAAGLQVLLRHKFPSADLETGVFYVLVTVARAVREGKVQTDDALVAEVRAAANAFVEDARVASGAEPAVPADEVRHALQQLNTKEQEILIRFYHLVQTDQEISREMKIPVEAIRKVKKTARERFLAKRSGLRN